MAYQTQPGTIPHRVIEWLKTQPPGTKKTLAELAEAIGFESYPSEIKVYLRAARYAGLIKHDGDGGPADRWFLGSGTPLDPRTPAQKQADAEIGKTAEPVQRIVAAATSTAATGRAPASYMPDFPRVPAPTPAPTPAPAPIRTLGPTRSNTLLPSPDSKPREFDYLVRRNGVMELEGVEITADGKVRLTADQVSEIRRVVAWMPPPRSDV